MDATLKTFRQVQLGLSSKIRKRKCHFLSWQLILEVEKLPFLYYIPVTFFFLTDTQDKTSSSDLSSLMLSGFLS